MRAMILAAGAGTRLGALTRETPKPLLEVGGRPILDRTIARCRDAGITHLVINLHHGAEAIRSRYGTGGAFGVRIEYSFEPALLGTAGALVCARELLGDRFLVLYGDNVFLFPFTSMLDLDAQKRRSGTLGVYARRDVSASGLVEVDSSGTVRTFLEKPGRVLPGDHLVFAGIAILANQMLDLLPDGRSDIGRDLVPRVLAKGETLLAFQIEEGGLMWVDTPDDLARTTQALSATDTP